MTFVIGNIHGKKEKYDKILARLNMTDRDSAFVMGNIIDGEQGMEILQDMMYRPDLYPLLGYQEYMAIRLLPLIEREGSIEKALLSADSQEKELLEGWLGTDCRKFISDYLALDSEGREAVRDYLCEFELYDEITEGNKRFLMCFAGIGSFSEDKSLTDYSAEDFLLCDTDYEKIYFSDRYLITAGKPAALIGKEFAGKVYSKKRHIALECGAAFGGPVAAVCLNPLKVYYA